jgi:PncC family amidohydrolase
MPNIIPQGVRTDRVDKLCLSAGCPVIIYSMVENIIEIKVGELLRPLGLKLAVAESCTGGLVGHRITNVPGSSEYFLGGVTAYAYESKVKLLGVSWDTLTRYGAVSRETVLEMARGARRALEADIGISVSGIAGPGGGMPEKPVGLTWIGLSASGFEEARSFVFPGDRLEVKQQAAEQALRLLNEYLATVSAG